MRLVIPPNVLLGGRLGCGFVVGERSRSEHLMHQLHHDLNREGLLEKRDMIGDRLVRFTFMIRQARHEDHTGCLLHLHGALDDVVSMNPWIWVLGGGELKVGRRQHEIGQQQINGLLVGGQYL